MSDSKPSTEPPVHPEPAPPEPIPPAEHPEPLSAAATIAPPIELEPEPKPLQPTEAEEKAAKEEAEEVDAAAKAEADKAFRADNCLTAAANGDPAGIAFGPRIDAAKFEHRNQGHDDTMQLLDDMLAGIQRLEAKLAEGQSR